MHVRIGEFRATSLAVLKVPKLNWRVHQHMPIKFLGEFLVDRQAWPRRSLRGPCTSFGT